MYILPFSLPALASPLLCHSLRSTLLMQYGPTFYIQPLTAFVILTRLSFSVALIGIRSIPRDCGNALRKQSRNIHVSCDFMLRALLRRPIPGLISTSYPIAKDHSSSFHSSSRCTMLHHLMVGTWTPPGAIFTFQFDDEALTLKMIKRTTIPEDEPISWITFDASY